MNKKALLHLFNEFSPVLAFFIAAQFYSFYTATIVLIISTLFALAAGWFFQRHFPILPIISGFFVVISGFITVKYQIPDALIFADSLYYFMMGISISIGLAFKVNILKMIFFRTFAMHNEGWLVLARRWIIIFILAGIANEVARHTLSPDGWVIFKFLKVVIVTLIGTYQFTISRKYRIPESSNEWGIRTS
jgi:intracellular septation protein A